MKCRLAVAYDADSSSPIEIVRAVGQDCDVIWVVDGAQLVGVMHRALTRLGTVVDVAELSPDDMTSEVARHEPDGVVAFSDSQLLTASAIATGLGLRFNSPAVTQLFLDKYEQRRALQAAGVPGPRFASIPPDVSSAEIVEHVRGFEFPAVLKPRRGYGSRDTYRVESAEELLRLLAPTIGDRVVTAEEYVIEEYLPDGSASTDPTFGGYVSVESVVTDGKPRHLAVTGKFPLAEPFRETGNFMPSGLAEADETLVVAAADDVLTALGAAFGCFHTEIKMTPAGPRVIESNARVGGGGIDDIFFMSYGQSLLHLAAKSALGIELPARIELRSGVIAYQLFLQAPMSAHRLARTERLDEVSAFPGVSQLSLNRRVGDETDWRDGSQGYVLSIRGSAPDHDALRAICARIQQTLTLEYS